METRTVEIVLEQSDGHLTARLTVRYPPPPAVSYAGQHWHRTRGFSPGEPAVYQPDCPFARPATQEQPIPKLAPGVSPTRR